jgi:hypothetical protein
MNIQAYKTALEAAGFKVVGNGVVDHAGITVAEDHPHGFWSKSAEVDAILAKPVAKPKPAPVFVEPEQDAEE